MNKFRYSLVMAAMSICYATYADINLIAIGSINPNYEDLAFNTAPALENGIAGNRLGGMGSGLAYAGGNQFVALPDRGPNALPYDSSVDDTASYIPRFHTLSLSLAPSPAGSALPYVLSAHLLNTTLMSSPDPLSYGSHVPAINSIDSKNYFSGRSDNFDPALASNNPLNARLDPEGIRVSRLQHSVFVSDEYGPYIYQFDRRSGRRINSFALPAKLAVANQSAQGAVEIATNSSGRVTNKGMEGLAISPDGRYLFGAMQSPLIQDGGTNAPYTRIIKLDIGTGAVHEYAYELSNIGTVDKPKYTTVSEIVAINSHEFLVDERDGKGLGDNSSTASKKLYRIDLSGAQDVSAVIGASNLASKVVAKSVFLDVVAALNNAGIASQDIPAKIEGVTFGPDIVVGGVSKHTLFLANDNDYVATVTDSLHPTGVDNANKFFVFTIDSESLPGFIPQQFGKPSSLLK